MLQPERAYFLGDIVTDNARWAPAAPALIFGDSIHSWADFEACVQALKRGLTAQGVRRGTYVAVLDRNSDRYIFLHYALAALGAVICPINMWLRAGEIAYILSRIRPPLLVTSDEFRELAGAAASAIDLQPRFVTYGTPRDGDLDWDAIADGPEPETVAQPETWDDPHMILFTSGTTGRPKGAIITHRRTVLDGMAATGGFGIRRGERLYNYLPLFHTGAWDYLKLVFMSQGAVVLVDHFEPDEAITLIERHRCNILFGVPVVLRKMLESPRWDGSDLSSLRVLAFGNYDPGDFLDTVLARFRERGAASIEALFPYGMTEGGPFVTIARPNDTRDHPNTVGTPLPGVSVRLFDDEGGEVPHGEVGEICVRSPALMAGYLGQAEATAEAFAGGWMHTGDLGCIDEAGFLCLVGRKKDMVRTGGENVYASEVEQLLIGHPAIAQVAVVGLPDPDYGEMVVAAVVAHGGATLSEQDVIAFARERIAGFKAPRRVFFLDDLPRNPAGKVAKHEVRQALSAAQDPETTMQQEGR